MRQFLILLISATFAMQASAQYVYTIKADSVKLTACDSTELIIENHSQGVSGFLFNKGRGRTEFRRALIRLTDSTYLLGADTLKVGGPQYWAANGTHIYNLNTGNVGIRRQQPVTTLDLPGAINIDDTSSYQINYHPAVRIGAFDGDVYEDLKVGDSAGANAASGYNTSIGGKAGYKNDGINSTNVGTNAGRNVTNDPSLGGDNTNMGADAGAYAAGSENTYIGSYTGASAIGSFNTLTGAYAGAFDNNGRFQGDYNSIYGAWAGTNWGSPNDLFGYEAGYNSVGSGNVFMGMSCGSWLLDSSNNNVCIGEGAFSGLNLASEGSSFGGSSNTIIGYHAGTSRCTGCVVLGSDAYAGNGLMQNCITIGTGTYVNSNNTVVLGNNSVQNWLLGLSTPVSGRALIVGSTSSNGNGAYLTSGGVWTNASDRNKKENFQSLSESDILSKINQLPVTRWNYKGLTEQHIGPVAQDFHRIFNVGSDDKTISTIDPAGIALAGIQGLYHKWQYAESKARSQAVQIKDQQSEIDELKTQLQEQKKDLQLVLEKLHSLETAINQKEIRKEDVVIGKN